LLFLRFIAAIEMGGFDKCVTGVLPCFRVRALAGY
jgi:hypothetical protein